MSRVIVLLSGGMDSTVMLHHLHNTGHVVRGLTIDYGQRHAREMVCAKKQCSALNVQWEVIDLRSLSPWLGHNCLTEDSIPVPEGHYAAENMKATVVPNRNMLLLAVALSRCVAVDFDAVAYAAHAGDHTIYPDCRPEFAAAMEQAAALCDFKPRALLRPFVNWTKAEIARRGHELGVDFSNTWSCYRGGEEPCGKCGTCVERIEALA